MTDEQVELLKFFNKFFEDKNDARIALYGLGVNTGFLIPHIKNQTLVGLMDAEHIGEIFYGKKVLSSEEVIGKVDYVIIVARPTYQNMIYRRIKNLSQYGIKIMNLYGMPLEDNSPVQSDNPYWQKNISELKKLIDAHDVISFDVFDTLITRKVLLPYNIFDRIEIKIAENFGESVKFRAVRIAAEEKAKLNGIPTLEKIYAEINISTWNEETKKTVMQWELDEELNCLLPRDSMKEIFNCAKNLNKIVVITSDMYLTAQQISEILQRNGYDGWQKIFVSCDFNKSKDQGELYDILKSNYPDKKILHIGDNEKADGENAKLHGVDSYIIYSPYQAFQASACCKLADNVNNRNASDLLGCFVARSFNDPYALCKTKGVPAVMKGEDLGYNYFAPLILCFVRYLLNVSKNYSRPLILLSGRDGYIIKNVLDLVKNFSQISLPNYEYFLTSRRAICMPNFYTEEDILAVLTKFTSTTPLSTVLREQFSICLDNKEKDLRFSLPYDMEKLISAVKPYMPQILERAKLERANYLKYIQKNFDIDNSDIIVFDLMTTGTIPTGVKNLLNRRVSVLAFSANIPNADEFVNIHSLFPYKENFLEKGAFLRFFHMWECVLTAPTGQFECFDEQGQPIFREDTKPAQLSTLQDVWRGIYNYVNDNYNFLTNDNNGQIAADMADKIFGELTNRGHLVLNDAMKNVFVFEDNFKGGGMILLGV